MVFHSLTGMRCLLHLCRSANGNACMHDLSTHSLPFHQSHHTILTNQNPLNKLTSHDEVRVCAQHLTCLCALQVPPGQIGLGRNRGRRLRYDAHMPLGPPSLQIKSPPLWSALLRKSAMHSRAEHLSAASPAPGLLQVLWHMQKLSFACHYCTR